MTGGWKRRWRKRPTRRAPSRSPRTRTAPDARSPRPVGRRRQERPGLESAGATLLARNASEARRPMERPARHPLHRIQGHPFLAPPDPDGARLWRGAPVDPPRKHRKGRTGATQGRFSGPSRFRPRAHPPGDGCRLRGDRPAEPLQLPDSHAEIPCNPNSDGAAQRAYRPARSETRPRVHLASGREGVRRRSGGLGRQGGRAGRGSRIPDAGGDQDSTTSARTSGASDR